MINKKFEEIKNDICFRLINSDAYKEVLESLPHVEVLDLSAIFYYKMGEGFKEGAIVDITNEDVKAWDISIEELDKLARENTVRLLPSVFQTIEQVIDDIAKEESLPSPIEEEPKERMYVLTNEEKYFGGGCFLYPEVLEEISQKLNMDFFVLPSSTHENIIMPEIGDVNAENLSKMVEEMNEQFLEEDEILSDEVYKYDKEAKTLSMTGANNKKIDMSNMVAKPLEERISDETRIAEGKRR